MEEGGVQIDPRIVELRVRHGSGVDTVAVPLPKQAFSQNTPKITILQSCVAHLSSVNMPKSFQSFAHDPFFVLFCLATTIKL